MRTLPQGQAVAASEFLDDVAEVVYGEGRGEMTNLEVNQYIATEILDLRVFRASEVKYRGQHDKEWYSTDTGLYVLSKKKRPATHMIDARPLPNFCSDDSPRSLLNEVVAKVIPKNADRMAFIVNGICPVLMQLNLDSNIHAVELTAEQIARACVAAWQAK